MFLCIWCHALHSFVLWISWLIFIDTLTFYCFCPFYFSYSYSWSFLSTQEVHLNISCGVGLVIMNSFNSCLTGKLFISLFVLSNIEYSWLHTFPIRHFEYKTWHSSYWPAKFWWKISWWPYGVSLVYNCFILSCCSLSLLFAILITVCLDVDLLRLVFLGTLYVSWI